jgi:hypothetical protein
MGVLALSQRACALYISIRRGGRRSDLRFN